MAGARYGWVYGLTVIVNTACAQQQRLQQLQAVAVAFYERTTGRGEDRVVYQRQLTDTERASTYKLLYHSSTYHVYRRRTQHKNWGTRSHLENAGARLQGCNKMESHSCIETFRNIHTLALSSNAIIATATATLSNANTAQIALRWGGGVVPHFQNSDTALV